ncbi:hypothetical protein MRX96_028763 [Rhipicephalus microplus]
MGSRSALSRRETPAYRDRFLGAQLAHLARGSTRRQSVLLAEPVTSCCLLALRAATHEPSAVPADPLRELSAHCRPRVNDPLVYDRGQKVSSMAGAGVFVSRSK